MLSSEVNLLKALTEKEASVSQLGRALGLSTSYVSELVSSLEKKGLVTKNKKIRLAEAAKTRALLALMAKYSLEKLLSKPNEEVALQLLSPKTAREIMEATGLKKTAVYDALQELGEVGAARKEAEDYFLSDEPLIKKYFSILKEEKAAEGLEEYAVLVHSDGNRLKKVPKAKEAKGFLTAFSMFPSHGIPVSAVYDFYSDKKPGMEEVLVHALACSETKAERSLCALFFLKNQNGFELR